MTWRLLGSTAAVGLGMLVLSAPPAAADDRPGEQKQTQAQQAGEQGQQKRSVDELTRDWPEASRKAAKAMEQKYGAPDGVTDFRLTWQDKGPWKEIVLDKQEVQHNFPNLMVLASDHISPVAPHAGAWIETTSPALRRASAGVAPHAGAWIETSKRSSGKRTSPVAPHAGAWIETDSS